MRKEHQWTSAKVAGLEADSFFIKINCVAGAAYLSMPPADTCPTPPVLVCVCDCASAHPCMYGCVCVPIAIKQWEFYQTLPKAYEWSRGEYRPKISVFPREQRVLTESQEGNNLVLLTCFHQWYAIVYDTVNLVLCLKREVVNYLDSFQTSA